MSPVLTQSEDITADAIRRLEGCSSPRLRELTAGLIRHLHDFVREYQLSEAEWMTAIQFLTRTGQTCTEHRQEFILLSDVLAVSMVVDAVNHRAEGAVTESTILGPFYDGKQPELPYGASILRRGEPGEPLLFEGIVTSETGTPLAGAMLEVWQTAPNGMYDVQDGEQPQGHLRGTFRTDKEGRYSIRTIVPVSYPIPDDGPVGQLLAALGRHPYRPAHVHFMISAPNHERLITHLFIAGDQYLQSDAVFGVKQSLIVTPTMNDGVKYARYDFVLTGANR